MAGMFIDPRAYERYMGRWSARLAPLFADFAGVRDGGRVLDVGCGTGALVEVFAGRTRGDVVGVDSARPFVAYARSRFADSRIHFDCGRAADLPYRDASFGRSLSLLLFQLLEDGQKAAAEMRRVTRPGGTVAACAWDDTGLELAAVLWEEARRFDPDGVGRATEKRPRGGRDQLVSLWRSAGLEDVRDAVLDIRTEFSSFDDYWLPFLGGVGPAGSYVAGLAPELRESLREALRRTLLGERRDGRISLGARAWAACGTVPE